MVILTFAGDRLGQKSSRNRVAISSSFSVCLLPILIPDAALAPFSEHNEKLLPIKVIPINCMGNIVHGCCPHVTGEHIFLSKHYVTQSISYLPVDFSRARSNNESTFTLLWFQLKRGGGRTLISAYSHARYT